MLARLVSVSVLSAACGGAESHAPVAPMCPTAPPAPPPVATIASRAHGRLLTHDEVADEVIKSINKKDPRILVQLLDQDMREVLPAPEATALVEQVRDSKGAIISKARETDASDGSAVFRFKAERGEWILALALGTDGKIAGMNITSPAPRDPEVTSSSVPLGLPFRGQWSVVWGGDTPKANRPHLGNKSQRRAADLLIVDTQGKTHRDDGKKNTDYFAYGQDVLAAADGTVMTVIDGVPDNDPGSMNSFFVTGNIVILRHDEKLYSAYAHLQPRKTRVKVGAKVKRGDVLGLCGNSGNTSEPHLHFQLQDGPLFEKSFGVEPRFKETAVVRDGKALQIADYTWLKGDLVGVHQKR